MVQVVELDEQIMHILKSDNKKKDKLAMIENAR